MAGLARMLPPLVLLRSSSVLAGCASSVLVHTSSRAAAGEWRISAYNRKTWMSRSVKEYGPLTGLPDWSFTDGRPAPVIQTLTKDQLHRQRSRRILMDSVKRLIKKMDKDNARHEIYRGGCGLGREMDKAKASHRICTEEGVEGARSTSTDTLKE